MLLPQLRQHLTQCVEHQVDLTVTDRQWRQQTHGVFRCRYAEDMVLTQAADKSGSRIFGASTSPAACRRPAGHFRDDWRQGLRYRRAVFPHVAAHQP